MRKSVTLKILHEHNACDDRYEYLVGKLGADYGDETPITLLRILELNDASDCLWAFCCFDERPHRALNQIAVEIAIDYAAAVLELFENQFPHDDRPRLAIKAAKNYILANADAADAAADAAPYAAAYAAAKAAAYAAADAAAYAVTNQIDFNPIISRLRCLLSDAGY